MSHSIAMLFLAAGASRRMGRSKALLPWNGETIVAHHADLMASIEDCEAWIVMQPVDPELFAELDRINWPCERRVINPLAPDCDMAASIRCGLTAILKTDVQAVGIALIDQPMIRQATLESLFSAYRSQPEFIWQPEHEGRSGHPVILPQSFALKLIEYTHGSLRDFMLENSLSRKFNATADEGVVIDLDTPAEYDRHATRSVIKGVHP